MMTSSTDANPATTNQCYRNSGESRGTQLAFTLTSRPILARTATSRQMTRRRRLLRKRMRCRFAMVRITAGWALALTLLESSSAAAQEWRCTPIRHGDSAATLARNLTGDARHRTAPWFQIVDPASQTILPKAGYDRIRPGWRACI